MRKSYLATIITPEGEVFNSSIESLRAPGAEGSLGVLSGHAPILALLREGVLKLTKEGKELFFAIGSGVLEVNGDHNVTVLSDKANPIDQFQK